MKKISFLLLFSVTIFLFSTCSSVSGARDVAEEFYNSIKIHEYDNVIDLLDDAALDVSPREIWVAGLKDLNEQRGDIETFIKTGFETKTNNGNTIVILNYKVTYTNGVYDEILTFYKVGDKYKIYDYRVGE